MIYKNRSNRFSILCVCVLGMLSDIQAEDQMARPNILFIMADDHAAHAISSYGSDLINTPGLDRLAKEGMRFTNCFNVNSICGPSRAALISGMYNYHNGVKYLYDEFDGEQPTFPRMLQGAGYETALIGKWHLVTQPTGFNYYSVLHGQGDFFNPRFLETGTTWGENQEVEGYLTDIITDKSIQWLEERESEKPFMLMVHHKAPHTPHQYPKKYESLYADSDLPLPDNFWAAYGQRGTALAASRGRWSKLDYITHPHFQEPVPDHLKDGSKAYKRWAYQHFLKGYLRLVASLDDNVGRLLDYLDHSGLSQDTIVVYTSDNGFFLGDFGMFNKMWMYEESLRLPLMVRYPGHIKPQSVNDDFISILDFASTFLDYGRAQVPVEYQGDSFRSILEGETPKDWRKAHYYHYFGQHDIPPHYGVRTPEYKLIYYYENDSWELFDLIEDPREMRNQYDNPEQTPVIARLKKILSELRLKYES